MELSPHLSEGLDADQRAAVEAFGPRTLVLAGAGSGKTRVLTYGLAHLLLDYGFDPQELMLLTFTRRAAQEMGERAALIADRDLSELHSGTFHAVAMRLLAQWQPEREVHVLDESDCVLLAGQARQRYFEEDGPPDFALPDDESLVTLFSRQREEECDILDLLSSERLRDGHRAITRMSEFYEQSKRDQGWSDYTDLLLDFRAYLQGDGPGLALRRQLRAVLVDEVQDLNRLQRQILALLCADGAWQVSVGDAEQSIYGFRGAEVSELEAFASDPQTRVVKLQRNYRSHPAIVALANRIAAPGPLAIQMQPNKRPSETEAVSWRVARDEQDEQQVLIDWMTKLTSEGAAAEDIAVLGRSHEDLLVGARAAASAGLEHALLARPRGKAARATQGLTAIMRLALDDRDRRAWEGILQLCNVSPDERGGLLTALVEADDPCERFGAEEGASALAQLLASVRGREVNAALWQELLLGPYGQILSTLEPTPTARAQMLQSLLAMAPPDASGPEFMSELTESAQTLGAGVRLATVHASKGLEWPHVAVVRCQRDGEPVFAHWYPPEQAAEEQRLLYVAVTRAEESLLRVGAPAQKR